MICVSYSIADSLIPGAGKGLFVKEYVQAGRVIIAPTAISHTVPLADLLSSASHPHADSSVRWFEDHCTIAPEWPDECYVNHSFTANGQWHLGFVMALRRIHPGEELLIDYRHLLGPGVKASFLDTETQCPIEGFSWEESFYRSTVALYHLVKELKLPQSPQY